MKNILTFFAVLTIAFMVVSCGDKKDDPTPMNSGNDTTSTFTSTKILAYSSDGTLNNANVTATLTTSVDSVNYSIRGNVNSRKREKNTACNESTSLVEIPVNTPGKLYLRVTSDGILTHVATITVSDNGDMIIKNYEQFSDHRITMGYCKGGLYRITAHYPNTDYPNELENY